MRILLHKVYYFSFSAIAGCTFNWSLVDLLQKQGRTIWLTAPTFDCDQLKKGEHEQYNAWCVKRIWK